MSATRLSKGVVLLIPSIVLGWIASAQAQFTTNAIFAGNNFGLTNQVWRYEETNNLDGTGWEQPGYNDSGWPSGRALLAGESSAWVAAFRGTTILLPNNTAASPPQGHARYFRTHFNYPTDPTGVTLNFNARCDDGMVVYLNGTEVWRLRPPATLTHASVGSPLPCGGDADCGDDLHSTNSPALVQGDNVLAVAVYQNAAGSSDIVWGTGLSAVLPYPPTITDPNQPSNRVVIANRLTTLNMQVIASPPPAFTWYFEPEGGGGFTPVTDGPGIGGATTANLTISNMAPANAGSYYCTAINAVGSATCRTSIVQYTTDDRGPVVARLSGDSSFTRIIVEYDEPVEALTAEDPFNYFISGGVTYPINAVLGADGKTVTLDTPTLAADTDYTIDISAVNDISANQMIATQAVVHTWILTPCGGMLFESYGGIGGNAVSDLTSHPNFPARPTEVFRVDGYSSRLAYPNDSVEAYGARMRALFIPPTTGNWRLYLWADDGSQLFFNPNGPDAAGKQLLLNRTACCGDFSSANSRTAPLALTAGQGYYLEVLYKEGVGGDYGQVAARLDGQPTPPTSEYIPGSQLGTPAAPPGIVGAITFSQQPTNFSVEAPGRGVFSAAASAPGAPFACHQWQKAEAGSGVFADLPGATTPTYTTPETTVADDNGDEYRVIVRALSGSVTSAVGVLTVLTDVTLPTVAKVASTNATTIAVVYSETMGASAANPASYGLSGGLNVTAAAVNGSNPRRIDLTVDAMTLGNLYTLTITGVADPTGNAINPDPSSATIRAQTYNGDPATIRVLPTAGRLPLGSLTDRGIMVRLVQISANIVNDNAVTEQMLGGVYPTAGAPAPNIAPLPLFIEPAALNYNRDAPGGASLGRLMPDAQFPGYPPGPTTPEAVQNNMAMEAIAYVELRQGVYRGGVNSDDGFRVTAGLSAEDPGNAFVLGEFNGGRGSADTTFDFCVQQDGLYPFRVAWEQGQGGANVEWWIQDLENLTAYYAVNGTTVSPGFPGGSPAAYLPPCSSKALTITRSGGNVTLSWPLAGGGHLFQLQQATVLATPGSATVWSNVDGVPQTTGASKSVTRPASGVARFFRLYRPGPGCTL